MAIVIAEVFAMFLQGQLAPTSGAAEEALKGSVRRHAVRVGVCPVEERDARREALQFMTKGRRRRAPCGMKPLAAVYRRATQTVPATATTHDN